MKILNALFVRTKSSVLKRCTMRHSRSGFFQNRRTRVKRRTVLKSIWIFKDKKLLKIFSNLQVPKCSFRTLSRILFKPYPRIFFELHLVTCILFRINSIKITYNLDLCKQLGHLLTWKFQEFACILTLVFTVNNLPKCSLESSVSQRLLGCEESSSCPSNVFWTSLINRRLECVVYNRKHCRASWSSCFGWRLLSQKNFNQLFSCIFKKFLNSLNKRVYEFHCQAGS